MVVVKTPAVRQVPRRRQRLEEFRRRQLVPQPSVEALHDPVLPWGAGVDVQRARAALFAPSLHRR